MKYVKETTAGKCISAYVITDKKGNWIADVIAHFGNSRVLVNVFAKGENDGSIQTGTASGYGYDKFTAALSGLKIAGITLNDHCGQDEKTEKLLKQYKSGKLTDEQLKSKAKKIGASPANYSKYINGQRSYNFVGNESKAKVTYSWDSVYYASGLDRLTALGYKVHRPI